MKNLIICYILVSIMLISCSDSQEKSKKEISRWIGKELHLKDSSYLYRIKKNPSYNSIKADRIKIVHYLNPMNCFNCLEDMKKWKNLMNEFDSCNVSFIFYIHIHDWKHINRYFITWDIDLPVIIDKQNWFKTKNNLPENKFLHTFLIDKSNSIVLIGDPLKNEKLKNLYIQKCQDLSNYNH